MYANDKNNIMRLLKYRADMDKYLKTVSEGNGTYKKFCRLVNVHLNMTIRSVKGLERDHIVPKSFCRKLGLTVEQTNNPKNIQYILPEKNMEKWSFIEEEEETHLKVMCPIWGIKYPSLEKIEAHNKLARENNLHKSLMKKAGKEIKEE